MRVAAIGGHGVNKLHGGKTSMELQEKLKEIWDGCDEEKYIFRGEKECYDKISSKLYRRYGELAEDVKNYSLPYESITLLLKMEKDIVNRAKNHFSPSTSNIEVLTDLQHYGGETALIDFTRNISVALFFACEGSPDKDGRIILFYKSEAAEKKDVDYYSTQENDYEIIAPTGKHPRIIFQSSVFVHAAKGYIEPGKCKIIRIPKELKRELLDYLRNHFYIERTTIYNDIHGFIQSQKELTEAEKKLYSGLKHQVKKNIEKAMKDYDEAIKLDPRCTEAYNNRGSAKSHLGKHEEAIKDYDQAIKLDPQDGMTYYNRGKAKSSLGKHEEAIKDYDQALESGPKAAVAYYSRGMAKAELGRHKEAQKDFSEARRLDPDGEGFCSICSNQRDSDALEVL
ncbi:MAG: tetratricopeptide repeat protein [Candidatus Dadabacteria bacterium]|nr:tetratricopeptide repeat protein [Candidatus Dadabacteria bacterium]MDE0477108.1 tetratricopeptide repeat protein [Candidatus Dadabacteria bacterium]